MHLLPRVSCVRTRRAMPGASFSITRSVEFAVSSTWMNDQPPAPLPTTGNVRGGSPQRSHLSGEIDVPGPSKLP